MEWPSGIAAPDMGYTVYIYIHIAYMAMLNILVESMNMYMAMSGYIEYRCVDTTIELHGYRMVIWIVTIRGMSQQTICYESN